jgi:L-ribulose-5-phosphate 3-epimerase UlaE
VGDGQIDFTSIFSKLAQYNYDGWAVLEWECCLKNSLVGAQEGAERIANWIIPTTSRAFDDFAATDVDSSSNRKALGLDE